MLRIDIALHMRIPLTHSQEIQGSTKHVIQKFPHTVKTNIVFN